MISLRKHVQAHGDELLSATVRAYRASLLLFSKTLASAVPGTGGTGGKSLGILAEQCQPHASATEIGGIQLAVESEVNRWTGEVDRHLKARAAEAREIMLSMATAAQSLMTRDKRYANRFRDLRSKLEGIGNLEDLSAVRRSLLTASQELNSDIQNLETEGIETIGGLEVKLQAYRNRLAESEKRECADPLTGIANRRGVEQWIERRREESRPFCIVLIDLDSFKPVNDTHGHAAGDEVLKQFAAELQAQFRSSDIVGRWGGDEFIAVVTGSAENAQACIDRVRKWAFGSYKINTPKGICAVSITAGIGLSVWDMREGTQELLDRADQAMYSDKRGRARSRLTLTR